MPTEFGFYHLTSTSLHQALGKLLGRVLALPARALVLCPDAQSLAAIDAALWASTDPEWLPHGTAATGQAAHQPIWLTDSAPGEEGAPNGARLLFLVGGSEAGSLAAFDRGFDLFDGSDEAAVVAARRRWAALRAAGHKLEYWSQGPGGWERKGA